MLKLPLGWIHFEEPPKVFRLTKPQLVGGVGCWTNANTFKVPLPVCWGGGDGGEADGRSLRLP